jgi:hypothetical protein
VLSGDDFIEAVGLLHGSDTAPNNCSRALNMSLRVSNNRANFGGA